jgi:prepilin-type N-terminal cleavage/methylation domain-containing protein
MGMARPMRSQEGFTLIEIMIAMTVLLIGFVGVLAMQISLTRESNFSRHTVEASMVGEQKMEELFAIPEVNMASSNDKVNSLGELVSDGLFERTWTVDRSNTALTTIKVSVKWNERGDDYTISLTSQRVVQ